MANRDFYSTQNVNLGAPQTDVWSGIVLSMPVVETSLCLFANTFDATAGAEVQNVRVLDQINIDSYAMSPISRDYLNDSRIQPISGGVVPFRSYAYGVELIMDNKTRANTTENVYGNCVKLLADWDARLQETLLFNMLKSATNTYTFSKGGQAGNTSEANIADLISAKQILDRNRVRRTFMRMMKATDQIGTRPVGQTFVGHVSVDGRAAWERAMTGDTNEIVRPFENPSVSDYIYQNLFYVKRADTSLYHSTEMQDEPDSRILILHGDEAYAKMNDTFNSQIVKDPDYRSSFGMHTKVGWRRVQGQSILRNERIVNCKFTD